MTTTNIDLVQAVDLSKILNKPSEQKATQLPKPAGYKILCAIPPQEEKIDGTELYKPAETLRYDELLTTVLFVVELGPDCYADKTKFPSGPWCKKGDFVLVRPNAGTRLIIHGQEFRMIYDDNVEGTVEDPRGIKRK
jgi:hypothetical protein